jgi:hypothetical protein
MNNDIWNKGPSNFVCAGGDCFVSLLGNFIDRHNELNYFDDDKIDGFLKNSVNKYLYSFGTGLSYKTKKMSPNHVARIAGEVKKIIERPFMKDKKLYIDSGGFQVAMGAVEAKDMPSFITKYHSFLQENHSNFSYAFSLDLPPGPATAVFETYEQLENLNRLSYRTTAALPPEVKDKMIYIHHFRTPSLYDSWSKFLWEEGLAEGFKNFATGGIVANMATDMTIPVIIYAIPLSEILKYAITKNMTEFNFHVLGGANFIDVFYHKLFSYHIQKVHNVKVNITYDSSAIFKGLAIGRFIPVFKDDGNLIKMDLRSDALHLRFENMLTVQDKVYQLLNEMASHYGFRKLTPETDPIYDEERNTFSRSVHMYLICYMLHIYRHLELMCETFVTEIYPLYTEKKQFEFDERCYEFAKKFNQGKNTRKQKAKIASIYKSLNILTTMDRTFNRHLIHKFMATDDISTMNRGCEILKF